MEVCPMMLSIQVQNKETTVLAAGKQGRQATGQNLFAPMLLSSAPLTNRKCLE